MVKKLFIVVLVTIASVHVQAVPNNSVNTSDVTIKEAFGWLETASVKWEPVAEAGSYNVYYSGEGITDKKIDTQLIRSYGSYFRADVVGLKAGNYTLTVKAVNEEGSEFAEATTSAVTVLAHDRSGFAFTQGGEPGAYKTDGTLKSGAQVLYLTANTAKTMTLDVVVNDKGGKETGTGIYEILKKREKGRDFTPLAIRIIGKLTNSDMPSGVVSDSYIDVKNTKNVTVEGIGDDATAFGWGVHARGSSNIEVRNLAFMRFGDDGVSLEVDNSNIWIHNNDVFYGKQGSGDKAKGDGAIDVKTSALVTVSYNHYWDSGKSNLTGNGTEPEERLTFHHNWYDHSDSRHPRVRCHTVHVYNNYYSNIAKYGVGSTMGSSIFSEANYFETTKNPMLISRQGTDVAGGSKGTFSSEDGGIIKAYNNYMDAFSKSYFRPYSETNTVEFDAYVVAERSETVPSHVTAKQGGATYNNFDTDPSIMYAYAPDSPEEAKARVMQYAGRMSGGDFQPSDKLGAQSDSDDPLSALSTAIDAYATKLVFIQGDGNSGGGDDGGGDDGGGDDPIIPGEGLAHNFTTEGMNSSFFSITGSLSSSKGTVNYGGLTLTQCLKIESSTSIQFSIDKKATLTLVFESSFSKKVVINGTSHTVNNGILTIELEAGAYEIKKGDTTNLFYMSIAYEEASTSTATPTPSKPFTIFPNPVESTLHVYGEDAIIAVEIYNAGGQLLSRVAGHQRSIDVSGLAAGTYFARIINSSGSNGQWIIKK